MIIITYDIYRSGKKRGTGIIQNNSMKSAIEELGKENLRLSNMQDFLANVRISEHTEELDF